MTEILKQAKAAAITMMSLTTVQKNLALETLESLLLEQEAQLLTGNRLDLDNFADKHAPLYQRLKLDADKLRQLREGMAALRLLPDPVGRILARTELDQDLILEKISVPLGVIGMVFEARPDVIPQILGLILKSGNAVLFKGGSEASHSAEAFSLLITELTRRCGFLPSGWATVLYSREDFQAMLAYPEYVDLIVPRGSNQLVRSIQESTRIPVLGHADGVCHLYLHSFDDFDTALRIIIDAKSQYPAACNSVETLLVDTSLGAACVDSLRSALQAAGITLCEPDDWHTEYGDNRLSFKLVDNPQAAIRHINLWSSHHTDGILTVDKTLATEFCRSIDSANVFVNCSTRFADGMRYGLGAELGISTAKTHARGPVGLEGLVIYKYILRGTGQCVADYSGPAARKFSHRALT